MYRLRRWRLENIGHAAAGFKSLVLDLTGGVSHIDGTPMSAVDVILWLRNGGGKSSLLSLFFSLFLPAKIDFIGHKKGKSLADYVPDHKVSHVVTEWEDTSLLRGGPALITGGVYQWEDGLRPADPGTGWERLVRRWYAFRPLPGVLDLDSLPVRTEAGQLTQTGFLKQLADTHKAHRALALRVTEDQTKWRVLLTDLRLDPGVLRIQRNMNREEGGITDLFQFPTCEDFVDFLIDLVCDPRQAAEVRASLEEAATKIAQRPGREREQSFLAAAALALKPVREHGALAVAQQESLTQQLSVARRAGEHLSSRAEALGSVAAGAIAQADQARAAACTAEQRVGQETRRLVVLTHEAAQWAVLDADKEVERCEEKAAAADVTRQAWELVDTVVELEAQQQQAQALQELLEHHSVKQAPLHEAMEVAGAALRERLTAVAGELTGEVAQAQRVCEETAAACTAAEAASRQSAKEAWHARDRLERRAKKLEAGELEVAAARRDGLIGSSESPGDAHDRYEAERTAVAQRLEACRQQRDKTLSRLSVLMDRRRVGAGQLTAVHERHSSEWDRLGSLQTQRRELAADRRLLELACAEAGTVLDMDQVAADLLGLLASAGRHCDARLTQEQANAAEDRRALAALNDFGFLPAPAEVEQAVQQLRELGAPAVSGLQFLREAFTLEDHDAVLAAVPHLIGGVVVCGPLPDGQDLATLARRSGVRPAVIAVSADGSARQALAAADDSGTVVLPVHPGLLDPDAAERERIRLERRLDGLDGRVAGLVRQRETDAELARRLQRHMDEFGAGPREALEREVARLEQEVATLQDSDRLLGDQITRARQESDASGPDIDALTTRLLELTDRLPTVRTLADQYVRVIPACRTAMEEAGEALARHQAAARRHDTTRKSTAARQEAARERLRQLQDRLRRHTSEIRQLDTAIPAGRTHTLSAATLASTALETLRGRYEQARRDWENEIGDDTLRVRAGHCAERIADLTRTLDGRPDEVLAEADRLARSVQSGEAEDRSRARAEAASAEQDALEQRGVAKQAKRQADEARDAAWAAVEALAPPLGTDRDDKGPLASAAAARRAQAKAEEAVEQARAEAHAHQLRAAEQQIAAEKARNAAHAIGRCAHGVRTAAERYGGTAPEAQTTADASSADALLRALLERLQITAAPMAALSPEQAEAMEEAVVAEVDSAAGACDSARRRHEKSVRRVHALAQDRAHAEVVEGQLLERLLTDLTHPVRLAELIDDIGLREQVVLGELAELADDQLMVVQACLGLVKTALDDVQQVARHSRLPQGLGSWSGQQFLSLEIRHLPDDEVLARRLATEIDRMSAAVAQSTAAGKATALPEAMTLTKQLVLASLGGRGNVVAKIIKPTQSLDTVQRDSVTQIQKFSGGEMLTVSVLLYCTLARLRAAKQGRKASGGVGTLVLDNPFGKANYTPFVGLQRKVAAAHGIQLVYTTGSNDLPALERFPLIIRLRNGIDARTRTQYVQVADRFGDAVGRGLQYATADGISSARLHRHTAQQTGREDDSTAGIPPQSGEARSGNDAGHDQ